MGYRPTVNCRHCSDPLDVYMPPSERFCSEECQNEFRVENPGILEKDEAKERDPV